MSACSRRYELQFTEVVLMHICIPRSSMYTASTGLCSAKPSSIKRPWSGIEADGHLVEKSCSAGSLTQNAAHMVYLCKIFNTRTDRCQDWARLLQLVQFQPKLFSAMMGFEMPWSRTLRPLLLPALCLLPRPPVPVSESRAPFAPDMK